VLSARLGPSEGNRWVRLHANRPIPTRRSWTPSVREQRGCAGSGVDRGLA
jgi:hypothetical protein